MNQALPKVIAAEPIERKLVKALKSGVIKALEADAQITEAVQTGLISALEAELLREVRTLTHEFISVDDFDPAELPASGVQPVAEKMRSAA